MSLRYSLYLCRKPTRKSDQLARLDLLALTALQAKSDPRGRKAIPVAWGRRVSKGRRASSVLTVLRVRKELPVLVEHKVLLAVMVLTA